MLEPLQIRKRKKLYITTHPWNFPMLFAILSVKKGSIFPLGRHFHVLTFFNVHSEEIATLNTMREITKEAMSYSG